MTKRINQLVAIVVLVLATGAFAADYTWTGGGVAGDWTDTNNWTGGAATPGDGDTATIPDGFGGSFTNVPAKLYGLTTGDTAASFDVATTVFDIGGANNATITIGSGGATFNKIIRFPNNGGKIVANGDLTAPTIQFSNGGHSITQNGGVFDIDNFSTRDFDIVAWDFAPNKPLTIGGSYNGTTVFAESPVFSAGHRPDWNMSAGGLDSIWNLNGKTLIGDDIALMGHPNLDRSAVLVSSVPGAVIDANTLKLTAPNKKSYLNLAGATVIIRGTGTAWSIDSLRNTEFDITQNTTVTFDPTGGALSIDTGSVDTGDFWTGYTDNFAFDAMVIGSGDIVTLEGTADASLGGGLTALYAWTLTGDNSTLVLNGHNVYLRSEASGITFDTSGGGMVFVVPEPATGMLVALAALVATKRRRHQPRQA